MTTITSTTGNDNLNGGAGDDVMFGGAGSDKMNGGSGADVMDGGSGSDSLNGGSGRDTLIYTLAENRGATDLYMGGSGVDTVRLQFTDAEWRSTVVQNQIAYYLRHLATVKTNVNTGEVSNGTASDFTFVFDSSTRLTISMMEALDVWVDGQQFDFRAPFVTSTSGLRAVIEDTGVVSGHLQTAGLITFTDTEWDQAHSVNAVPSSGNAFGGILSAVVSNAATGDGAGTVSWSYRVANSSTQHLAAGETSTESFLITIDDGHGGVAEQTVSITITGTNDAPLISVGAGDSAAASLSETNSGLSASGTLTVRDPDTSDTVGSSVVQVSATGATGALTNDQLLAMLSVAPAANLAANSADAHNLTWSFDSGSEAFNYLAATESLALAYTLRSSDGHGGVAEQTVSITITGTNDATPDILLTISGAPGNSLPNGIFGQLTAINDGAGAHTYSLVSLTATTLAGATAPNFAGDLSISSGGSLSAANLDDNRIYSMQVQAQQGTATVTKAFSIITGTNVGNNLNGAGDDVIYGQNGNDVILAGSGADSVFGQSGDDTINGGLGNDTLTGGGNNDTFVFDTSLDAINNVDTITDFNANTGDQIQLDQTIFSALTVGTSLNADHFRANAGGSAVDANDHILYDSTTGNLYYDADGNGAGLKALFATLHVSNGTLDSSDFSVRA